MRPLIMRELPEPRTAFVHLSGDFTSKEETVHPGTLPFFRACHAAKTSTASIWLAGWCHRTIR